MMNKKDIITIINRSDSIIRGIIDDLKIFVYGTPPNEAEQHWTCDKDIYELIKKYKDMLTVTTPKQRREAKK